MKMKKAEHKNEPVDILVGSAGALNKMFTSKMFSPDFIHTVILDEFDTMIDDTFRGLTSVLLTKLRKHFIEYLNNPMTCLLPWNALHFMGTLVFFSVLALNVSSLVRTSNRNLSPDTGK